MITVCADLELGRHDHDVMMMLKVAVSLWNFWLRRYERNFEGVTSHRCLVWSCDIGDIVYILDE